MYYLMNKNEKIAKTAFEGAAWAASEHNIPGVWHGWFICQVLDQTSYAVEPDEFTYSGTYYREHNRGSVTTG